MNRRFLDIALLAAVFGLYPAVGVTAQEPPAPTPVPQPMPVEEPPPPALPGTEPAPDEPDAPVAAEPPTTRPERTLDPAVEPAGDEGPNPLPLATTPPNGQAPAQLGGNPSAPASPYMLPNDALPLGRQAIALTVDVRSPQVINLGKESTLQVVVKNAGTTDAMGVEVRDPLPDGLEYVSSVPEAVRAGQVLNWKLGTLPAGSERTILVKVRATVVGSFDHAATVSMLTGGRSRTMVQQPLLKVEQKVTPSRVLKGQQVEFRISIENPGTGPARDVVVQAKLTSGLKHPEGNHVELKLASIDIPAVAAGKRIELDPLIVDTTIPGVQECVVTASSPDVTPTPEATSTAQVTVVEPKLSLEIVGPADRYTEQLAAYSLVVENRGTAPARNVRITSLVDKGVRLTAVSDNAKFDTAENRLTWDFPQIEPGAKQTVSFQIRTGGIGLCQIAGRVAADGIAPENATKNTNVKGIADVVFDVQGQHRVLDVGDTTTYAIRLRNQGTKEATGLLVSALLSKNLEIVNTEGTEQDAAKNTTSPEGPQLKFPVIDRLGTSSASGRQLIIRVRAIAPGQAFCRVYLHHEDLDTPIDRVAVTRVYDVAELKSP